MFLFWNELSEEEQCTFLQQLDSIDVGLIATLQSQAVDQMAVEISPAKALPLDATEKFAGEEIITSGALGVLTVAGGQGTRLGWSGPKGTFPAGPVSGKSLFQLVAEQIVFAIKKYNTTIPWYIMTSNENEDATKSFLLDNNCFGLERTDIFIFSQGAMPAVDEQGKILLATKGRVATNPDGHGGVITALQKSGGLEEMKARGIVYLSYTQIDNPLVHVIDPVFLGMHIGEQSSAEASSKCVRKAHADERVGVLCLVDTKTTIIEYSDLPTESAKQVDSNGELLFYAGSIAIHLITVEFLLQVADELPWHKAYKKVPHICLSTGNRVEPKEPNAYKFERFVFDILPMAKQSLVVETDRSEEFAPIKNATGTVDSPLTSTTLQMARATKWLRKHGVEVQSNAQVEISPLTASTSLELEGLDLPKIVRVDEPTVV